MVHGTRLGLKVKSYEVHREKEKKSLNEILYYFEQCVRSRYVEDDWIKNTINDVDWTSFYRLQQWAWYSMAGWHQRSPSRLRLRIKVKKTIFWSCWSRWKQLQHSLFSSFFFALPTMLSMLTLCIGAGAIDKTRTRL